MQRCGCGVSLIPKGQARTMTNLWPLHDIRMTSLAQRWNLGVRPGFELGKLPSRMRHDPPPIPRLAAARLRSAGPGRQRHPIAGPGAGCPRPDRYPGARSRRRRPAAQAAHRRPQHLPGRLPLLQRPSPQPDGGPSLLQRPGRRDVPVRDLRRQCRRCQADGRRVHHQRTAVQDPARGREGALAQPCARGEVGPTGRARRTPGGRTPADGQAGAHLRQDLAYLAYRSGPGAAPGRAPADDGLHRRRPARSQAARRA